MKKIMLLSMVFVFMLSISAFAHFQMIYSPEQRPENEKD
ncbi:hypothetical protein BLFGPEAP_01703 [Candidatus Methanoperedenaceae archaeon GB50]|nr:hypothetical protein BLFGPEAP_01703 [Candidatus Methanoperedenaceae archaeon GB50]